MILTRKHTLKLTVLLLAIMLVLAAFVQVGFSYAQTDDPEPEEGEEESGDAQNPLCTDPEAKPHPVLQGIAERYGVDYQQLVDWKCNEGYGVGEMMLALQTSGIVGEDAGALLGKKGKGKGWGLVWQELGLIGKESDGGPPPWAQNNKNKDKDNNGSSNGNGNGNGQGKPENPGQQGQHDDDDQDDEDDGPGNGQGQNGDHAGGPPDHANNDKDKPENEDKGDDDDDDGEDDGAQALTCESGLVLDGDTVEDANKLAEKYDVPTFEIIAQLCGGDTLNDVEDGLEGDD